MRIAYLLPALLLLPLAACSSVHDAVSTPQMSAIAYPAKLIPSEQTVMISSDSPRPASPNSLWRNGARAFFHDQRASHVGDILTVNININDNAKLQNETVANRKGSNSLGVPNLLGFESTLGRLLPKAFNPASAISTNSSTQSDGQSSVNRSEAITLTIAAVVTQVLPNGNLVIQGRQEVRTNQELRELTIAGIVRPEDITSTNTIQHTQIAEARVSYGGKGQLSTVQGVPAGQALLNKFSPF
jgi:flagellar L-ring protein precursor FlgH